MVQDGVWKMGSRRGMIVRGDPKEKRAALIAINTGSLNGPIEGSTMALVITVQCIVMGHLTPLMMKRPWQESIFPSKTPTHHGTL